MVTRAMNTMMNRTILPTGDSDTSANHLLSCSTPISPASPQPRTTASLPLPRDHFNRTVVQLVGDERPTESRKAPNEPCTGLPRLKLLELVFYISA